MPFVLLLRNIAENYDVRRDFASSWDEFRVEWFKCPQEWLDHVRNGLQILEGQGYQGEITTDEAVAKSLEAKAKGVKAIANVGGNNNPTGINQHSKQEKLEEGGQPDNVSLTSSRSKWGNSQDYLLSRIKRDRPDVIEKIGENKEFKSARAAAIYCGIVKVQKRLYFSTPEKMAKKLKEVLKPEEVRTLIELLLEVWISHSFSSSHWQAKRYRPSESLERGRRPRESLLKESSQLTETCLYSRSESATAGF